MTRWSTTYTREEFRLHIAYAVGEDRDIIEYFQDLQEVRRRPPGDPE